MQKLSFLILLLFSFIKPVPGQTFAHDFGGDGVARLSFGDGFGIFGTLTERADHSILLGGTVHVRTHLPSSLLILNRQNLCWIAAIDQNGNIDSTFGHKGQVAVSANGDNGRIDKLFEDSQRRIWAGGRNDSVIFMMRLLPDGRRDTTYGEQGIVSFKPVRSTAPAFLTNFVVDKHDNVYCLGRFYHQESIYLAKINSSGFMDANFGTAGVKILDDQDFPTMNLDKRLSGSDLKIYQDESIILGGTYQTSSTTRVAYFSKMDFKGNIDRDFGNQGLLDLSHLDFESLASFHLFPSGHILANDYQNPDKPAVKINLKGEPDSTFGMNGYIIPPEIYRPPITSLYPLWVRVDVNGKILISFYRGQNNFFVAKFNKNGIAIPSFGYKGYTYINLENESVSVKEVILSNTGRAFLLAKNTTLAAYNMQGQLDRDFHYRGFIIPQSHETGSAPYAMNKNHQGQVFIGGMAAMIEPNLTRFSYRAFLAHMDPQYPMQTIEIPMPPVFEEAWIQDIQFDKADNIFICGKKEKKAFLAKLSPSGKLDSTFGQHGFAFIPFLWIALDHDEFTKMAIQEDGKIITVGNIVNRAIAFRYLPSGELDPSFGDGGYQFVTWGQSKAKDVKLLADGRIHIVGEAQGDIFVSRLHPNGILDLSLAGKGVFYSDLGTVLEARAVGSTIDSDSTFVVVGQAGGLATARYTKTGNLSQTFSYTGISKAYFPDHRVEATSMIRCSDSTLIVVGNAFNRTSLTYQIAIAKFLKNGGLENRFGHEGSLILDLESKNEVPYDLIELADSSILISAAADGQSVVIKLIDALHFEDPSPDYGSPFREVKLYPNPLQQEFNIGYFNFNEQNVRIRLLTSLGQEVAVFLDEERNFGTQEETFLLPEGLTPGFYLISLESKGRRQVIKVVIK